MFSLWVETIQRASDYIWTQLNFTLAKDKKNPDRVEHECVEFPALTKIVNELRVVKETKTGKLELTQTLPLTTYQLMHKVLRNYSNNTWPDDTMERKVTYLNMSIE